MGEQTKGKPVGVASMLLGEAAVCLCWLPHVGWLGVVMGIVSNGLGVLAIAKHFRKTSNTSYGIAGVCTGCLALSVGLAVQIKHSGSALDWAVLPLSQGAGVAALGVSIALLIAGLFAARRRVFRTGTVLATCALIAFAWVGSSVLINADRALMAHQTTDP